MIDREEFRDLLYSIFYESVSDPAYLDGHFSLRPIEYKICREALN